MEGKLGVINSENSGHQLTIVRHSDSNALTISVHFHTCILSIPLKINIALH